LKVGPYQEALVTSFQDRFATLFRGGTSAWEIDAAVAINKVTATARQ
jgi:hypothetical protein